MLNQCATVSDDEILMIRRFRGFMETALFVERPRLYFGLPGSLIFDQFTLPSILWPKSSKARRSFLTATSLTTSFILSKVCNSCHTHSTSICGRTRGERCSAMRLASAFCPRESKNLPLTQSNACLILSNARATKSLVMSACSCFVTS